MPKGLAGLLVAILILQAVTAASVGIPAAYDLLELGGAPEVAEIVPDKGPAACSVATERALNQIKEDVSSATARDCRSREEPNGTFATVVEIRGVRVDRGEFSFGSSTVICPVQVDLELGQTSMSPISCYPSSSN